MFFLPHVSLTKHNAVLATAAVFTLLASCSTLTPTSLYKLSRFDPLAAAPEDLGIAVRSPEQLAVRENGATLTIKTDTLEEVFVLQSTLAAPEGLAPTTGTHLETFTIKPSDYERLRQVQADVRKLKSENDGKDVGGSLGVHADACRRGELPDGTLSLKVYMRTGAADAFFPLTRTIDLREISDEVEQDFKALPFCPRERASVKTGLSLRSVP
ncbi:hypothetical protein ABVF61_12895 [Roseibium sp. HPY-6]|uniref:hypothetical protein n=1 Tax=Roseibium sp. HPY-6 TaxID=3229852 RepID=UPI00339013D0